MSSTRYGGHKEAVGGRRRMTVRGRADWMTAIGVDLKKGERDATVKGVQELASNNTLRMLIVGGEG